MTASGGRGSHLPGGEGVVVAVLTVAVRKRRFPSGESRRRMRSHEEGSSVRDAAISGDCGKERRRRRAGDLPGVADGTFLDWSGQRSRCSLDFRINFNVQIERDRSLSFSRRRQTLGFRRGDVVDRSTTEPGVASAVEEGDNLFELEDSEICELLLRVGGGSEIPRRHDLDQVLHALKPRRCSILDCSLVFHYRKFDEIHSHYR